ncbi:MAG: hypothetical protein ACE5G0_19455 [Rhodothermales bacterium]
MAEPSSNAPSGGAQQLTPQTLNLVRFALLTGILLFGVIAWFMTSGETGFTANPEVAFLMRLAFIGVFAVAAVGMALMRRQVQRAGTFAKKAQRSLVGYALAEGVALYGAIYLFITGSALLFLVGLLVFLVAFLMFPVPGSEEG